MRLILPHSRAVPADAPVRPAERGSMAIELALLSPLIVAFMLLMIGFGRIVEAHGQVEGAARDAARAASVQRTASGADAHARDAAENELAGWCLGAPEVSRTGAFTAGSVITYQVTCDVDLSGLSMIGFDATKTISARASVPLETFRRVG